MTDPTADDQSLMAPLRQALLDCAAAGATITYQELAQRASFPGPHTIHRLTLLLEAMAREDHAPGRPLLAALRSEEHTSELQSLMPISYAVFCLKKKLKNN